MSDLLLGNLIILLGGCNTWVANAMLARFNKWGWVLKLAGIVCYTVAPCMMGLWTAVLVNGITAITQCMAFFKWARSEKSG